MTRADQGGWSRLLRNRGLVLYTGADAAYSTGYALFEISLIWLVYQLTRSPVILATVLFLQFGIYSLSFLFGPLVDRIGSPRRVLWLSWPLQGGLAALLYALDRAGALTAGVLLAVVVVQSFAGDLAWTATNNVAPRLVAPEDLFRANGLLSAVSGGNALAGYAGGAALLVFVGPQDGLLGWAIGALLGAFLLFGVSIPARDSVSRGWLRDFSDGWTTVRTAGQGALLQLSVYSMAQGFFARAPPLLLTVLAATLYTSAGASYAVLYAAFAIGTVVGPILLAQMNPRAHLGRFLLGGAIAQGVLLLVGVLWVRPLWLGAVSWWLVGAVSVVFYTGYVTYVQGTAPAGQFGRVLTNSYAFRGAAQSVGALGIGALITVLGGVNAGLTIGFVSVGVAVVGALSLPAVRRLSF